MHAVVYDEKKCESVPSKLNFVALQTLLFSGSSSEAVTHGLCVRVSRSVAQSRLAILSPNLGITVHLVALKKNNSHYRLPLSYIHVRVT